MTLRRIEASELMRAGALGLIADFLGDLFLNSTLLLHTVAVSSEVGR